MVTQLQLQPMKSAGTQHQIERTYREGSTFQWVRETLRNAVEAGASKVVYSVEWQGVAQHGVYRRMIADNGKGMTPDELEEFFNTFGGGGKHIGGMHENFGVGAKTSLLPWNRLGIVVISWVNGEPSMIRLQKHPDTGEYGLRTEAVEDEDGGLALENVYEPGWDQELEIDWSQVKPDFIDDHGTVLVLLGNSETDDTMLGDPTRNEADIKGIPAYLNRRWWHMEGIEVEVDTFRKSDRASWPTEYNYSSSKGGLLRLKIQGAKHYIRYEADRFTKGELGAEGTVTLSDGTEIDWYFWNGDRPVLGAFASEGGYIAALYDGELWALTSHHSTFRTFGVTEQEVRSKLWLIVRPPLAVHGSPIRGVYPNTARNQLLIQGGANAGDPLPMADWGGEFAVQMPEPIKEAQAAARAERDGGTVSDEIWRKRLQDRFGSRWRLTRLVSDREGRLRAKIDQAGGESEHPRPKRKRRTTRRDGPGKPIGNAGSGRVGQSDHGDARASERRIGGGIPSFDFTTSENADPGILAFWQPNNPDHPEGVVWIVVDHPVIEQQIEYWQSQYADVHTAAVKDEVLNVYGEIAVAKVAHSEHLRGVLPRHVIDENLRSDESLTMSLLGLLAEEAVIAPRMGQFGKRIAS